jgi:hypothetical protein
MALGISSLPISYPSENEFWHCVSKALLPLPQDIEEEITKMVGHYEHSKKFTNVIKQIPLAGTKSRLRYISNMYNSEQHYCMADLIEEIVNDQDYVISVLKTCRCCKRHSRKHPSSTSLWNGTPYFGEINSMPFTQDDYSCTCQCRHMSRQMVRSVTPTHEW